MFFGSNSFADVFHQVLSLFWAHLTAIHSLCMYGHVRSSATLPASAAITPIVKPSFHVHVIWLELRKSIDCSQQRKIGFQIKGETTPVNPNSNAVAITRSLQARKCVTATLFKAFCGHRWISGTKFPSIKGHWSEAHSSREGSKDFARSPWYNLGSFAPTLNQAENGRCFPDQL